jgi:hypothetical protein
VKRPPQSFRNLLTALGLIALSLPLAADNRVALTATASPDYTQRKFDGVKPRPETYVILEGKRTEGITADRSIDGMPFRRIVEYLAPELAKQQYFPTTDIKNADLLLVVHWGTTIPRITDDQLRGITTIDVTGGEDKAAEDITKKSIMSGGSPGTEAYLAAGDNQVLRQQMDELDRGNDRRSDVSRERTNARLLGYEAELNRLSRDTISSSEHEATMRMDLGGERYFIILRAYDLKQKPEPGGMRQPVWTLHANMGSPGQNFTTAINLMGNAASNYFGRDSQEMKTVRPKTRQGNVTLGPLEIKGTVPDPAKDK